MAAPSWSAITVVSLQTLALGGLVRSTVDLSAKFGAFLYPRMGRTSTTAPTSTAAPRCIIRRIPAAGGEHPGAIADLQGDTVAAVTATISASGNNAGNTTLTTTGTPTYAAGDMVSIYQSATPANSEFARISKFATTTTTLDGPTANAHNSDLIYNKADIFPPVWVEGGCTYEVIFDYGAAAAGGTILVECRGHQLDAIS